MYSFYEQDPGARSNIKQEQSDISFVSAEIMHEIWVCSAVFLKLKTF